MRQFDQLHRLIAIAVVGAMLFAPLAAVAQNRTQKGAQGTQGSAKKSAKSSAKSGTKSTSSKGPSGTQTGSSKKSAASGAAQASSRKTAAKSTAAKTPVTSAAKAPKTSTKNSETPAKAPNTAARAAAAGTAAAALTSATPAAGPAPRTDMPYAVVRSTTIHAAPDAAAVGQLQQGTPVEILARDRGWVRVRTEAWVKESDLTPSDPAIRTHVSAADIRSHPDKWRGVTVKWTVEYLAFRTADTLRQGLTPGESYLLARGPGQENTLMYLALPSSVLGTARALSPLSKVTVVARVRDGRSTPAGVPILDVQSLQSLP